MMPKTGKTKRYATRPVAPLAMSIKEFARSHGISVDMYFALARAGVGPAVMRVGARTLISVEAATAWRRAREGAAREQRGRRAALSSETPPAT